MEFQEEQPLLHLRTATVKLKLVVVQTQMNVQSVNNKSRAPRPPEKGYVVAFLLHAQANRAFPLDHFGDCSEPKRRYQDCLASNSLTTRHCRDIAQEYLSCRMDRYPANRFVAAPHLSQKSHEA